MPERFTSPSHFSRFASNIQECFASTLERRERRALREPWHIKLIRAQLRVTDNRHDAGMLEQMLWQKRRSFLGSLRKDRALARVKLGGVIQKSSILLPLLQIISTGVSESCAEGVATRDDTVWAQEVGKVFTDKWCTTTPDDKAMLDNILNEHDGICIPVDKRTIQQTAGR